MAATATTLTAPGQKPNHLGVAERTATIKGTLSELDNLVVVQGMIESCEGRTHLAVLVCKRFGFYCALGKPQVATCLKALRDLQKQGHLRLPPKRPGSVPCWRQRRLGRPVPEAEMVPSTVADVVGLQMLLVDPKDESNMRIWNELVAREHPQGDRRLVGRQLRYLVGSEHGWLGAVGFSASAMKLEAREQWIGWTDEQRHRHQDRVVNLSRLLIRPHVHCQNLASHVLGACLRVVGRDFETRYGFAPWLLESFVDIEHHRGTCFQAANWERIGQTKGRGRNDTDFQYKESVKDIYVYPLVDDFRTRMGLAPEQGSYLRPLALDSGLEASRWARQEFGQAELGDERLTKRLIKIAEDRSQRPDASYLEAVGGARDAVKGFYSFVDSKRESVTPEAILETHRERTIERIMAQQTVLVVQDTSDLNFSTRHHTKGLGFIGTNQTEAETRGLKLHSSLALTTDGIPLGVLKSVCYAPERVGDLGKQSIGRPIEEKKSFRWLEGHRDLVEVAKKSQSTRFLDVMDREADIFELFLDAEATRKRVGLLVRAKYNRKLEDQERKLFDELRANQNTTEMEIVVPRQRWKKAKQGKPEKKGMPARRAVLTVSYQQINIKSTRSDFRSKPPITLWAVYAREENPPQGAKPISWFLLTTEAVESAEDAAKIIEFYKKRWRIEEWHRVLKSGCKVQEHQHETAERLKRVIAIDAVLAWRIQLLTLLGREVPDLPCNVFFDEWEVKVLDALKKKEGKDKRGAPLTLGEAIILVAKQGGYLARKSDPPPGTESIWKGLIRLSDLTTGYRLATPEPAD